MIRISTKQEPQEMSQRLFRIARTDSGQDGSPEQGEGLSWGCRVQLYRHSFEPAGDILYSGTKILNKNADSKSRIVCY